MSDVEIYTTPLCGYCLRAKRLLDLKGVEYREIDVMLSAERRDEMIRRAGDHKVPKIFVDGESIGGSDDLMMLEASGELDRKLGVA